MIVNKFRTRAVPTVGCAYKSVSVPDTSVWIGLPTLKGLRPSRAEGIAALPARRPGFSLATPGLADGQGCSAAPSGKSEARRRRIRRKTSFRGDRHRDDARANREAARRRGICPAIPYREKLVRENGKVTATRPSRHLVSGRADASSDQVSACTPWAGLRDDGQR
jgi:hypothetical protein